MSKRQLEAAFLKGKVSALQEHGMSDRQISSSVGVPRSTIYKWKRSNFSLHRKPGSGRPRKTSPQSDDSIVSLARSDPNMSSSEIRQGSEASVSARTVQRRLREADFRSLKKPSAVELTDSHKRARLQWAMRHCHWRSQWDRVVWSDEASVYLRRRDGRLRIWMKRGCRIPDHLVLPVTQGGGRLLIWGAIWTNGRTELHIQRENMNSERYVQVLERFIYPLSFRLGDPSTDWWLMDDNATCHRSAVTNSYKSQASIRTLSWPARSPDLNPIENMWSLLKRRVRRLLLPGDDLLRLENLLKEEWNEISQATVNRLIGSMPTRVHDVIELSGESTRF